MRVLILGSGGRESALESAITWSPSCKQVWVAPGNGGSRNPVALDLGNFKEIRDFCHANGVDLVVVGPEKPLVLGVADYLRDQGFAVFGPSAAAAKIESSKLYARALMLRAGVPQPQFFPCTDLASACHIIRNEFPQSCVVKADGLAGGKGAVVCDTPSEAEAAAKQMLEQRIFGDAGSITLIEERLFGTEFSLFVLTDGVRAVPLASAQDYKRLLDGDRGPNTGGMGSISPAPIMNADNVERVMQEIVRPTLQRMRDEGVIYSGCLYIGGMWTDQGPKVIEFNCRFGDPETQSIVPLLDCDMLALLYACATGRVDLEMVSLWDHCAVTIVLASNGYPVKPQVGSEIMNLDRVLASDEFGVDLSLFHAGTRREGDKVYSSGGRVLSVTAVALNYESAREVAMKAANEIRFDGKMMRTDIGVGLT